MAAIDLTKAPGVNRNYQPDNGGYSVTLSLCPGRGRSRDTYRVRCFYCDPRDFNAMGRTEFEDRFTSYAAAERTAKALAKEYSAQLFYNC